MITTSNRATGSTLDRRAFLTAASTLAAGSSIGLLAGCSTTGSTGGGGNAVPLPTQVPFTGVKPDLPGDPAKGVYPGFFAYPAADQLVKTVKGKVGSGGDVTNLVVTFSPPPPALGQNAYWQAINKALNVDLKPTLVPGAVPGDFETKLAAVLTGNDVPDIVTVYPGQAWGLRRYESVVKARFADLSDFLSGDAVKQYPNLARLPQAAWKPCIVGGRIYATPTLKIATGAALFCRSDLVKKAGADPAPKDKASFEDFCEKFTDAGRKRWALANDGTWLGGLFFPMFGVANSWKLDGGKLTSNIEADEWQEAIAYIAETWKKGWWHPDSPRGAGLQSDPLFAAGTIAVRADNIVRYTVRGKLEFPVDLIEPFLADGGPGAQFTTPDTDFITFIKKGAKAEVEEHLRVLDYLSAPLGSEENFLRTYGVPTADHTVDDGRATLTERGTTETSSLSLRFVAGGPDTLFASNGDEEMVKKIHTYQTNVAGNRVINPVADTYVEAIATSGQLTQLVNDAVNNVVLGRSPVSSLKDTVATWKKSGGDKIRKEYEAAIAEQKKS